MTKTGDKERNMGEEETFAKDKENFVARTFALTKLYGQKAALNNVDVHIRRGDIYGLIGKNGAGKTTLLKLLLGLITPSSGEMELFGSRNLSEERMRIGSLIEEPALYKNETAAENMKRFAILAGKPDENTDELLRFVGLDGVGKKKVKAFSLGMRQRLGIAVALIGNPEFLVLDEPINGLDPAGIKEIRDTISDLHKKGVTFIISSHILDELGKIATVYGIVNNGDLVEEITAEELKSRCKKAIVVSTDNPEKAVEIIKKNYKEAAVSVENGDVVISSEVNAADINMLLNKNDIKVDSLKDRNMDFEDFFIERLGD